MENTDHLIHWIRKIQINWELDLSKLSRISHVSEEVLKKHLSLSESEIAALPSIPSGLESSVALVGIFRRVQGVYPTPEEQNSWLLKPNNIFEGNKPIDVMAMSAEHLSYVSYTVESGLRLS